MIPSTTQPQIYMHNNDYENSLKRIDEGSVVVGNRISEVNVSSVGVGTHSFSPNNVRNVPPAGSSASGWCTECVSVVNSRIPSSIPNDKKNVSNVNNNVTNDVLYNANTSSIEVGNEGDLVRDKNVTLLTHSDDQMEKMNDGLYEKCDIFDGKWVRDDSKPYYPLGSCPFIDRDFNCYLNGRLDLEYVKWKWKPNKCDIP
ncbi:hypothetical protein L195_g034495, partial [Trifolium pratense]